MAQTTPVFKATRKELWAALSANNLTEGHTWKTSSREQMIVILVKHDINDVPTIGESDALLKKLSKTFTPAFFKSIKELEVMFSTVAETTDTSDSSAATVDDAVEAPAEHPEPSDRELALAQSVKKN